MSTVLIHIQNALSVLHIPWQKNINPWCLQLLSYDVFNPAHWKKYSVVYNLLACNPPCKQGPIRVALRKLPCFIKKVYFSIQSLPITQYYYLGSRTCAHRILSHWCKGTVSWDSGGFWHEQAGLDKNLWKFLISVIILLTYCNLYKYFQESKMLFKKRDRVFFFIRDSSFFEGALSRDFDFVFFTYHPVWHRWQIYRCLWQSM
jgi:hypothetical protein